MNVTVVSAAAGQHHAFTSQQTEAQQGEEEAPDVQDGSQWWHGMFTRAGKMGTMASDIRSDDRPENKQVMFLPVLYKAEAGHLSATHVSVQHEICM